jgi:hypothetical protein
MRSNISAVISTGTLPWTTDRFGNPVAKPENLHGFTGRNRHPDAELADPNANAVTCAIPPNAITPGMKKKRREVGLICTQKARNIYTLVCAHTLECMKKSCTCACTFMHSRVFMFFPSRTSASLLNPIFRSLLSSSLTSSLAP